MISFLPRPHPPTQISNLQIKWNHRKFKASLIKNIHTTFKFLSLNPQRRKKIFSQSSFKMTWLQTFAAIHFKTAFWGRNFFFPNMSYKQKETQDYLSISFWYTRIHDPPQKQRHVPSISSDGFRKEMATSGYSQ